MKTIYTSLPIYDRLQKQCFERAKAGHSGYDIPVPIICPRHKLPSFQWNDNGSVMGAVSKIELIDTIGESYNVPCGFTGWTNVGYNTWSASGLNVLNAVNNDGASARATSIGYFYGRTGETIRIKGNIVVSSASGPIVEVYIGGGLEYSSANLTTGAVNVTYTFTSDGVIAVHLTILLANTTFSFSDVEITIDSINAFFPALPGATVLTTDIYYTYEGNTLNYLLPEGVYYLKITTANSYVLYSDWFKVDCVYENLITSWINDTYETLTSSGTKITSAIETGVGGAAVSSEFSVIKGETITLIGYFVRTSGQRPYFRLYSGYQAGVTYGVAISNMEQLTADGLFEITFITTATVDNAYVWMQNNSAANFQILEMLVKSDYSKKYLTINYSNSCDLGDILYHDGLLQTVWFESEPMENTYPQDEEGAKNGDDRFVKSFSRQVKKYTAKTKEMPDFMVEVFNRMKLHDTIEMIDLVGNVNDVYNLEVEHEWLGDDKYYAKIELTFDYNEAFVIAGCCNNLV